MGKWSTYRRRGRSAGPAGPGPPPAPTIQVVGMDLHQFANGVDDTGGQVKLWISDDGGITWLLNGTEPWAADFEWDDVEEYEGFKVHCTEIGNGVAYSGESSPSNELNF